MFTRLSFLLPERLPHSSFPVEVGTPEPSFNYGLISHYSGNWSAPRRSWFSRNWSRIDIMRCAVSSGSQGPSKPAPKDNKTSKADVKIPESQVKRKTEEPKISGAEIKDFSSNSAAAEILNIGAKLEKEKVKETDAKTAVLLNIGAKLEKEKLKESETTAAEKLDIGAKLENEKVKQTDANAKVINSNATVNASSAKFGEVSAETSDTAAKVEKKICEISANSTDTLFGKEISENNVTEKKLGVMQAKLGVVEAKLSEPPQAKFSGADYALNPKELLREISRCRQTKTQKKIVIDNNASGFFKKIKMLRLEKWRRFPRSRIEDDSKKSPKDESPKT